MCWNWFVFFPRSVPAASAWPTASSLVSASQSLKIHRRRVASCVVKCPERIKPACKMLLFCIYSVILTNPFLEICRSSFAWNFPPYDIPDMFSKPGTPCNDYNGYCDVFQKCREVRYEAWYEEADFSRHFIRRLIQADRWPHSDDFYYPMPVWLPFNYGSLTIGTRSSSWSSPCWSLW